jgi:class 3 adenylate cyclase
MVTYRTSSVLNRLLLVVILFLLPQLVLAQDEGAGFAELSKKLDNELSAAASQRDKKTLGHTYGSIAGIYLSIAKFSHDEIKPNGNISADKKDNLNKAIDYANKSVDAARDAGDRDQMIAAYKTMQNAQSKAGKYADVVVTKKKILELNNGIFASKKNNEIEKKNIEYENARKLDSVRKQQELSQQQYQQQLKESNQKLSQNQQQLDATNQNLSKAEQEKANVNKALQKTQTDLTMEKSYAEEKEKQLNLAEEEKSLQAANLLLKENELKMKDQLLEQRKKERIFYIFGIIAMVVISVLIFRSFHMQRKSNLALSKEKKRSEELLLNILPPEVAEELMVKGFADAKHFHNVTVLFTDFVSFTSVAESMTPQQLVGELHVCFKAFDGILGKYHIEKIKTVGDAYMAVSGLPIANPNHAADVVAAAIEIKEFMLKRKKELGKGTFSMRIGINSGEVVAGIVGVRKFSYDIWGDTVNIAARMEQNSEEGKINISASTYELIKDKYPCIYRGKIEAKNKGSIDMYYVS